MNNLNIISPTKDIMALKEDMNRWSNLPYHQRKKSDEDCLRLYGMTNKELYIRIAEGNFDDNSVLENTLIELDGDSAFNFFSDNLEEFNWRKQMSIELSKSPDISIIFPYLKEQDDSGKVPDNIEYQNDLDSKIKELNLIFNKYNLLSTDNKRISDSYSMNLWGYTVPNMYTIIKNILDKGNNITDTDITLIESSSEMLISPVIENINYQITNGNLIGLQTHKLDFCNPDMSILEKTIYSSIKESVNNPINFNNVLPKVTPYFTLDEMKEIGELEIGNIDPGKYYSILNDKILKYRITKDPELAKEILALGWNPEVDLTESNLNFARERQLRWLNKKSTKVIDISNFNTITESSKIDKLYEENNLYPIYIILSYSGGIFGNTIRKVKNCTYAHAGMSLDSNLNQICTFKFGFEFNGFFVESLKDYLKRTDEAIIDVLVLFVTKETKNKVELVIKDFVKNQKKTKYGFGNLFNILINRKKDNNPENLSLVCSQFVDTVLKLSNIDITDKNSNLVIPQDFETVSNNPKVYKVYEGEVKEYNSRKVDDLIYSLLQKHEIRESTYISMMEGLNNTVKSFYCITENESANTILEDTRELLSPNSVIHEKKFIFNVSDKGDLEINIAKSLEDEYQEAHKLLTSYSDKNISGIKHELARLFFINSTIEKRIKKMKKGDKSYKTFIDLRARVLNDFKKYFKVVTDKEPDFNFTEYFKSTEYNNSNIVIGNSTLKYSGKLIKNFIKSLGV